MEDNRALSLPRRAAGAHAFAPPLDIRVPAQARRQLAWPQLAEPELAEPQLIAPPLAEPESAHSELARLELARLELAQLELAQSGLSQSASRHWYRSDPESVTQPLVVIPGPAVDRPVVPAMRQVRPPGEYRRDHRDRRGRGLLSGLVLVAAGSVAFALLSGSPARPAVTRPHPAVPVPAAVNRELAAAWVASQVSPNARVACDPVMCDALATHGIPSSDLVRLRAWATSPRGAQVLVATAAVGRLLGSRLSAVYAPVVLASFGAGRSLVDVRVVARHGAAAYRHRLHADLAARKESGAALLHSSRIAASATARRQLSAGLVDVRLQVTIAAAAAIRPVYLAGFGDSGPGASAGVPLRAVYLSQPGGGQVAPAFVQAMLGYLRGPDAPYPSLQAGTLTLPSGQTVLEIEFGAPSPLGLLSPIER